jgi:hypothetical protein
MKSIEIPLTPFYKGGMHKIPLAPFRKGGMLLCGEVLPFF